VTSSPTFGVDLLSIHLIAGLPNGAYPVSIWGNTRRTSFSSVAP
jgi:hypothetical protein